jgi:hypothetical protein
MIENKTTEMEIIRLMESSEHRFYLTGSRYFGTSGPSSDWDFFVDGDIPDLDLWLMNAGFKVESPCIYSKHNTTQVWRHMTLPIHVQLVEKAEKKNHIQSLIKSNMVIRNEFNNMSKDHVKTVWDIVYLVLKSEEEKQVDE